MGGSPEPRAGFGLSDLPSAMGLPVMVAPHVRSEVADPGLAGWPAAVRAEIGDRVIRIDAATDRGCVGKHIGGIAQQELFAKTGRNLVTIDRDVSSRQVNDWFQVDGAPGPKQSAQLTEYDRTDVLDAADSGAGHQRFGGEMHVDHYTWPRAVWVERRRRDLE